MEKLIITAAITGGRITREMTPHIPITPEEIIQSAYECWQAGAAIVHIHVRDPKTERRGHRNGHEIITFYLFFHMRLKTIPKLLQSYLII